MSYGVYTADLKGMSYRGASLEDCKRYLWPGHVICTEKTRTIGFKVGIEIRWKFMGLSFRPFWQYVQIGPLILRWERIRHTWADKIVYAEKQDGGQP